MSAIKDLENFVGQFIDGGPYLKNAEVTKKIKAVYREGYWWGFLSGGLIVFIIAIVVSFIK